MTTYKDTNPKDAVGIKKPPMSTLPATVLPELGLAMLEGARKYGRHNYRISRVRYSVYYDAAMRHLMQAWEGEDIDPDSGLPHIVKAMASLVVLRDAQIQDKVVDDRPPVTKAGWLRDLQPQVEELFKKYPEAHPAYTNSDVETEDPELCWHTSKEAKQHWVSVITGYCSACKGPCQIK